MTRKRPPKLVDPQSAHNAVTLNLLGVPTGRDRSLADQRARRAEPGSDRPKTVTGNIDDGTVFNDLLNVLQQRNIIVNKAERGGRFGEQLHNAALVNADSPLMAVKTQGTSDTASTTNVAPAATVSAMTDALTLGVGKWAVIVLGSVHLSNSTGGSSDVSVEIDSVEGTVRSVTNVGTTGTRCEAEFQVISESDWLDGEQTINIRVRFRSTSAGTTSAKNPALLTIAKRME